jgi:hypothetical protein
VTAILDSGLLDTVVLTVLLILLVVNEVLSGINLEEVVRLRRMVLIGIIPLTVIFLLVAALRITHLV